MLLFVLLIQSLREIINWKPINKIEEMCLDGWRWQKTILMDISNIMIIVLNDFYPILSNNYHD